MTGADKKLLDRETSLKAAQNFNYAFNLVNEVLDYGTHLLSKALQNGPDDRIALCLIGVQFRQVLAHLDAVAVLVTSGNTFSAGLQLRSLLEIKFAIEWILKNDTDSKINHLYVANLRRRRQWQSIAISGTPEAGRNAVDLKRISLSDKQLSALHNEIKGINEILASPEFAAIDSKFQQHYADRHYDRPWYKVYGTPTIQKIAEELGKGKDYRVFYGHFSEIAHGANILKNISLGEDIFINPIREPAQVETVACMAVEFVIPVYALILKQYVPGDSPHFHKKYKNEWGTRFRAMFRNAK